MILFTPMLHVLIFYTFDIVMVSHSTLFHSIKHLLPSLFNILLCANLFKLLLIFLHYYYNIGTVVKREITQSNDWSQRMLITYYWMVSWMSPKHFHSTRKLLRRLTASDSTTHLLSTTRRRFVDETFGRLGIWCIGSKTSDRS